MEGNSIDFHISGYQLPGNMAQRLIWKNLLLLARAICENFQVKIL